MSEIGGKSVHGVFSELGNSSARTSLSLDSDMKTVSTFSILKSKFKHLNFPIKVKSNTLKSIQNLPKDKLQQLNRRRINKYLKDNFHPINLEKKPDNLHAIFSTKRENENDNSVKNSDNTSTLNPLRTHKKENNKPKYAYFMNPFRTHKKENNKPKYADFIGDNSTVGGKSRTSTSFEISNPLYKGPIHLAEGLDNQKGVAEGTTLILPTGGETVQYRVINLNRDENPKFKSVLVASQEESARDAFSFSSAIDDQDTLPPYEVSKDRHPELVTSDASYLASDKPEF